MYPKMWQRILTSSYINNARFVTTNNIQNAVAGSLEPTNKVKYYKKFDVKQGKDDLKPPGWYEALPFHKIPGPKPIPILGNYWRFFPIIGDLYNLNPMALTKKFKEKYGKIFILKGMSLLSRDTLFITTPEDFETLFRNEGVWPIRGGLQAIEYYRNKVRKDIYQGVASLASVHGEDWFNLRTKVNPILMQPKVLEQYIGSMHCVACDFVNNIRYFASTNSKGEMPDDFLNEICKWALESVALVALDKRLGCLDPNLPKDSEIQKVLSAMKDFFVLMYKLERLPSLWKYYSTKTWKRFVETSDTINFTIMKYVDEMAAITKDTLNDIPENEMSVLQRLLKIDKKVALAMCTDMVAAGIDTTGNTTASALYFLARYPEVQTKLREELYRVLPKKDSPITKAVLSEVPYLKATIKETSRVAPISIGNTRDTVKDIVLAGYQIPKGTAVVATGLMVANSEEHFQRAHEFIPERWLRSTSGELSYKNVNQFTYLPFGYGPRTCIGKRLANLEMEVVLAKIIRNFYLEWPHPDMEFQCNMVYSIAKPLKLHVKEVEK